MPLPIYASPLERVWHYTYRGICAVIFVFLIGPIFVIIPLSFNELPYFTFTPEMLSLDPAGYSTKWYYEFFTEASWQDAVRNSLVIAVFATLISTVLGTLAALGLSRSEMPFKTAFMALLISPMIVPLIISATGMYFFYALIGISSTHLGVILAHAALGTPFVLITVTATLAGFDQSLPQVAATLGANPVQTFFKVTMPLILPGVVSGALFAFITSFDEVVVVLFVGSVEQRTIPWKMFSGIREEIRPTILAVATLLVCVSILLLTTLELLRRRSERLRGIRPS
ncbi:MAG: ABC transporter permease [Deltaproteobacteria bacterium]|nr:ABC transporter permease [Deltaproteobacteria bacterium]